LGNVEKSQPSLAKSQVMNILLLGKKAAQLQEQLSISLTIQFPNSSKSHPGFNSSVNSNQINVTSVEQISSEQAGEVPEFFRDLNFDLCIVDELALSEAQAWIATKKQLVPREFLPVLLIVDRGAKNSQHWQQFACVDEVIFNPVDPDELSIRVKNLLRGRSLSLLTTRESLLSAANQQTSQEEIVQKITTNITSQVSPVEPLVRDLFHNFVAEIQDYAIFMLDAQGRVTSWNAGAQRIMGYTAAEIIGQHFSKFYPEADRLAGKPEQELQLVITAGQCEDEGWRQRASGLKFWAQNTIYALYDDSGGEHPTPNHDRKQHQTARVIGFSVITHDLSDRKQIEEELCLLNRSLRTIWECSQAMVRASAESELLNEICRIIVEIGKYPLAWVGLTEASHIVKPVACNGIALKYIESLNLSWDDPSPEIDSIGKVISTGQPYICQDICQDIYPDILTPADLTPWRDWAIRHGYAACIYLPLISRPLDGEMRKTKDKKLMQQSPQNIVGANGGSPVQCFGVLTIYATEANAFDLQEVKLLQELANDLAYGIMALRDRKELIQAEAALRESEQRYRQLVQLLPDAIIIHNQGTIELINAAGIKLLTGDVLRHYSGDSHSDTYGNWPENKGDCRSSGANLVGRKLQNFIQEISNIFEEPISPVSDSPEAIPFRETTIQRLDGQVIPVHAASITYQYREISSVLTVLRNISQRKKTLEALQESEQRFRITFTGAAIGMAILGLDGEFLEVNSALQAMLGYTESQLRSMTLIQVTHADDLAVGIHLFQQMLQNKWENYQIEQRYINSRSQVVWGNLSISIIRNRENIPQFIIAMVEDITERKRAEQELRQYRDHLEELVQLRTREKTRLIISLQETNEKLQKEVSDRRRAESELLRVTQAVESTSDAVAMTDLKGLATYHNPAFFNIFGYTLEDINSAGGIWEIFANQTVGEEIFNKIIQGKSWSGEVQLRTRNGQLLDTFLRVDAVKDENNQIIGAIAVNTDITQIKQAEAIARETSEQLRSLINAMPDIVCFKDSQGHWKIANQAMLELLNLQDINYQGKTDRQLADAIEAKYGISNYRETLTTCDKTDEIAWEQSTISHSEEIIQGRDGRLRNFEVTKVPLFHLDGSPNAIVVIGRDVTDRRVAEAALIRLASIVESSDDAIIGKTLDGMIQSWNAGAERIYGYTAAEVQGRSILLLGLPDRASEVPQLLAGIEKGTSIDHYETTHRRKDGQQIHVSLTLSPIKDAKGQIIGVSTIARDITDLKRIEEALERIRHHNELILNSAGEGICGLDDQGNTTFINRAAAQMLGYSITELHGKPFRIILNSNSAPIYAALKDGSVHHATDAVFWRKNGSTFPVDYISTPIKEQGKIVGAVVTFNDISDRLVIERMKNEFISVVSHELRTPLTSIRGAMGLLAGGLLDTNPEKAQRMLDIAVANTDRLVRLINDILDLERIQSGQVTMRQQMFDLADLMVQASDTMRGLAEKEGITLIVEPLSTQVWGDSDRIFQVLTNLLSNAIKFSERHTSVWFNAEIEENSFSPGTTRRTLLIRVQDQGRGIPPDKLETIFGRFQQVDSSDSRKKGGTGLGLAICRSIIDYHRGQIWAESQPGQGSCFYVSLPLSPEISP
jgi:PAS domain S-box-containing protein